MKNNLLDLRTKLIEKMVMEWIQSIETTDPEELCMRMEELREQISKGA